jgi:hypothetical protein
MLEPWVKYPLVAQTLAGKASAIRNRANNIFIDRTIAFSSFRLFMFLFVTNRNPLNEQVDV